ncbi:MAG: hypothetical protein QNJ98_19605 [Planctomycetota bacterium]|nr:hypothetical protein [Planctomycetota bacterium]
MLHRVEPVEWCYDGLGGKIIEWTMENGSPKDHPSLLAFLVGVDGKVEALLDNNQQYNAGGLTKWLDEQLRAYEKAHPRTRLPFVLADVSARGEDEERTASCKEIEQAHEDGTPVLIFVGRERFEPKDKAAKKEHKKARSFQKKVLDAKSPSKEKAGWAFFRLDLADDDHAVLAKAWGVEAAPALLAWLPGAEAPKDLGPRINAYQLTKLLKETKPSASK